MNFIKDKMIVEFSLFYLVLSDLCWFGFGVLYFCLVVFLYYKLTDLFVVEEFLRNCPTLKGLDDLETTERTGPHNY